MRIPLIAMLVKLTDFAILKGIYSKNVLLISLIQCPTIHTHDFNHVIHLFLAFTDIHQTFYNNTPLFPLFSYQQKQLKLGDKMDLWSYLLKPVQRISKYSLLLQDMVRECDPGQIREIAELKAALEVIHFQLRHGNNLLAMDAIHHCDVRRTLVALTLVLCNLIIMIRRCEVFKFICIIQNIV